VGRPLFSEFVKVVVIECFPLNQIAHRYESDGQFDLTTLAHFLTLVSTLRALAAIPTG
jgi:hypothetical protein